MRVQINKTKPEMLKRLARKYLNDALEGGAILGEKEWPYKIDPEIWKRAIVARFCDSCGTEFFGLWEIPSADFEHDFSVPNWSDLLSVYGAVRDKADNEYERSLNQEIYWMQSLKCCPICGKPLTRDPGCYFEGEPEIVPKVIKNKTLPDWKPKDPFVGQHFYGRDSFFRLNGTNYLKWREHQKPISINVNKVFDEMKELRISREETSAQNETDHFIEKCNVPAQTSTPQETVDKIKGSAADLKAYVLHLIKLESSIHSVTQRLNTLYLKRIPIDRKVVADRVAPAVELKGKVEEAELKHQTAIVQREKLEKAAPEPIELDIPQKPTPPVLEKPGLFNKKSVLAKNEALQMQYQADLAEYTLLQQNYLAEKARLEQEARDKLEQQRTKAEERVSATKKELERLKSRYEECIGNGAETSTPASQVKALFDKEICDAEDLLRNLYKCRNELYSYGVVYEKYQNVVAVSTFYEYLMSGRCEALEGVNGAYNLYESELRADLIIGRLDQITETLEQIRDNQYTLYSEIKKTNTHLSNLQYTMDEVVSGIDGMKAELKDISENTKVIAYNTEATAYYTKMTAELTNAMGYMVAFK